MANPIAPNFTPGTGSRLATDRFDFQSHVDGNSFHHIATSINLLPNLVINGNNTTTVQEAITQLINIVEPPSTALATATNPGVIQLSPTGDVQGSALNLRVTAIRGFPINANPPSLNNVLTWNGSSWGPSPSQGVFSAGGDLTGTSSSQQVIGLSGNTGTHPGFRTVLSSADIIQFYNTVNPTITQDDTSTGSGIDMHITAQSSTAAAGSGNGGKLLLTGGTGSATVSGKAGGVSLLLKNSSTMIEASEVILNQKVVAFCTTSGLNSSNMPAGTGDNVIFIHDCSTVPSTSPVNGSILYSNSGTLNIRQANGVDFSIGTTPNPNTWNSSPLNTPPSTGTIPAFGKIVYNTATSSPVSTNTQAFSFPIPTSSAIKMNIDYIGKEVGTGNTAEYNYQIGFSRNSSGAPNGVGTNTSTDPRTLGGFWTAPPAPSISGNNIIISTGNSTIAIANWVIIIEISITTA